MQLKMVKMGSGNIDQRKSTCLAYMRSWIQFPKQHTNTHIKKKKKERIRW